ncbi:peptidoglycan-binding protein [Streptomyces sp. NPDC094154]|uniref:peptidoglycan-binding domain-containing protein n=1 Tax=Streptomyces sp. NPDC094154 TaxID=3366059 RepID=UPI00382BA259
MTSGAAGTAGAAGAAGQEPQPSPPNTDSTMVLRALPAEAASARGAAPADARTAQKGDPTGSAPGRQDTSAQPSTGQQGTPAESTMALRAIPAQPPARTTPPATGLFAPPPGEPSAADVSMFDTATAEDRAATWNSAAGAEGSGDPAGRPGRAGTRHGGRRTRPAVVVAAGAAVVTVVAGAGFASGLFSYESPERDHASRQVRESVPDAWVETPTASASTSTVPSYTPSVAASTGESPPPGADVSPSASASAPGTAEPSPSGPEAENAPAPGPESAGPTETATTLRESAPAAPAPAPVLRRGDQGAGVTELQLRLGQLFLFPGKADGFFGHRLEKSVRTYQWTRGISGDDPGVYGPATRACLESETKAP